MINARSCWHRTQGLVQFVHKVSEMCRGKAYFTTH